VPNFFRDRPRWLIGSREGQARAKQRDCKNVLDHFDLLLVLKFNSTSACLRMAVQ
jgi:hypothetical protein